MLNSTLQKSVVTKILSQQSAVTENKTINQ